MFDALVGQEHLKKFLAHEIRNNTLSHGYIIEGPKYMGKSFIALNIAMEITTPTYTTMVLPTEDRKLLSVDDIRAMKETAYSSAFGGSKKVYIVPNADEMTPQAQNAFLKLLEEPPQDCVFLLLAEDRYNLLSTIRSRCILLRLERYKDAEIQAYLKIQGIESTPEIIKLCDGTLTKYTSAILDKNYAKVEELAYRILLHIRELHNARVFAITKHIKGLQDYVNDILDIFLIWYKDLYVYKQTGLTENIDNQTRLKDLIKQSEIYTIEEVSEIINQVNCAKLKLEYNGNLEMTIEILLLYMRGVV
jgi:DNA polymerase-3 subunit delta'